MNQDHEVASGPVTAPVGHNERRHSCVCNHATMGTAVTQTKKHVRVFKEFLLTIEKTLVAPSG